MKVVRLSKREFEKRFGDADAITERFKGTEPTIYVPGRSSTKEMLHEIYHAKYSPDLEEIERGKEWQTPDELGLEELRAQVFASERVGMEDLPWNMVGGIARVMLNDGYKPATIMGSITRALEREGYEPLDKDQRSALWHLLREVYSRR